MLSQQEEDLHLGVLCVETLTCQHMFGPLLRSIAGGGAVPKSLLISTCSKGALVVVGVCWGYTVGTLISESTHRG